jgi:hypothetical protein
MSQHDDRSIGELIKLAGERDRPSPEAMERARAAAQASWQRGREAAQPRVSRRWLTLIPLAAAAGIAALVVGLRAPDAVPVPRDVVARIVNLQGGALLDGAPVSTGAALMSGTTLETRAGRLALQLGDAMSLRVAAGTRLKLDGPDRVTLLAGAIYVDSGGLTTSRKLTIDTPFGLVRHVGTQFQVELIGTATRVRVREGRVLVQPSGRASEAIALGVGDELRAEDGKAQVSRGLASFGPAWDWAADLAPPFDIENRPLAEFLTWLAREQGWQLRYATGAEQQTALGIRLHGSVTGLDASASLARVGLITGVPLVARDGVLEVGVTR